MGGKKTLILELMDMDLEQYWKRAREKPISYRFMLKIFVQIGHGLLHLHRNNVIHRDLKPQNILVKIKGSEILVKLCDFGHSKEHVVGPASLSCPRGTLGYMSPEMSSYIVAPTEAIAGAATDIYSFGVVMCESLLGKRAFYPTWINETIPMPLKVLLHECRYDAESSRPTASSVCNKLKDFISAEWSASQISFKSGDANFELVPF